MTQQSATLTFLSNGYGEDSIAVSLAQALRQEGVSWQMRAFPTVDEGRSYEGHMSVLGPRRIMPSGGLLFHNWELFKADMRAGFVTMTAQQVWQLSQIKTDILLVVGDAYALLLSSLVPCKYRFFLQSLVSTHHQPDRLLPHRLFMERIAYPERFLMRQLASHIYVRDALTAEFLRARGVARVSALGNPMLDSLAGQALNVKRRPVITLLPGTRQYAAQALGLMLASLQHLPAVTALVAWAGSSLPSLPAQWQELPHDETEGLLQKLGYGDTEVLILEGRFADCLHSADLVLGTSGTANEQAAALGKPVLSFPVEPLYSQAFLHNQKRLLADALTLCAADPRQIADALMALYRDSARYQHAAKVGPERMGKPGGATAIARDIIARVGQL